MGEIGAIALDDRLNATTNGAAIFWDAKTGGKTDME